MESEICSHPDHGRSTGNAWAVFLRVLWVRQGCSGSFCRVEDRSAGWGWYEEQQEEPWVDFGLPPFVPLSVSGVWCLGEKRQSGLVDRACSLEIVLAL
jgi:hypothetical protein